MSRSQRAVILLFCAVLVTLFLFPPWRQVRNGAFIGFRPIFDPPRRPGASESYGQLHSSVLLVEGLFAVVIFAALILVLNKKGP